MCRGTAERTVKEATVALEGMVTVKGEKDVLAVAVVVAHVGAVVVAELTVSRQR